MHRNQNNAPQTRARQSRDRTSRRSSARSAGAHPTYRGEGRALTGRFWMREGGSQGLCLGLPLNTKHTHTHTQTHLSTAIDWPSGSISGASACTAQSRRERWQFECTTTMATVYEATVAVAAPCGQGGDAHPTRQREADLHERDGSWERNQR